MPKKYTEEQKHKILDTFNTQIGKPLTARRIQDNGGVGLFYKLTNKKLPAESIATCLDRFVNPEKYKAWALNKKKGNTSGTNQLFDGIKDFQYILVPSHGDIACFESPEEVKKAIEQSQSSNIGMIKFKLLKQVAIQVKTSVDCKIG